MSQFTLDDINTIECDEEASFEDEALAIQRAINSGMWSLQGSHGRTMMGAIKDGTCMLGTKAASDYYGNTIPSRTQVQDGTKGSRGYVVKINGEEWAQMLEAA